MLRMNSSESPGPASSPHAWCWHDTPVGRLILVATEAGLTSVALPAQGPREPRPPDGSPSPHPAAQSTLAEARRQLDEYFAGRRRVFSLPLDIQGTPFQRRVWDVLAHIPYGHTLTYGDVASQIRQPTAMRAVGAASGQNPLPIVVPCHRVVGRHGRLGGYGGGLAMKQALLVLEGSRLV